jgi:zinc protease
MNSVSTVTNACFASLEQACFNDSVDEIVFMGAWLIADGGVYANILPSLRYVMPLEREIRMRRVGLGRLFTAALGLVAGFFASDRALALVNGVVRVTDRVFLVKDKPGSLTQFRMIVRAGCAHEAGGQCRGIAHYLEHLVIVGRGATNAPSGFGLIRDGQANAFTSHRSTVYVHSAPARPEGPAGDIERLFAFYRERLAGLPVSQEDVERERKIVLQEHNQRLKSSPSAAFSVEMQRRLLPNHAYGQTVIGSPTDIAAFDLAVAEKFRRDWYVPSNIYFVVKGDITPEKLKSLAEAGLGGLEARPPPALPYPSDPEFDIERQTFKMSGKEMTYRLISYRKLIRIPDKAVIEDTASLAIVSRFLSSRLSGSPHHVLVEGQALTTGEPSIGMRRIGPSTYQIGFSARPAAGVDDDKLIAAFESYLEELSRKGISEQTVERLKNRMLEQDKADRAQPDRVFASLVRFLTSDQPIERFGTWAQRVAAVDTHSVNRALKAFSTEGRVIIGKLEPSEVEK